MTQAQARAEAARDQAWAEMRSLKEALRILIERLLEWDNTQILSAREALVIAAVLQTAVGELVFREAQQEAHRECH